MTVVTSFRRVPGSDAVRGAADFLLSRYPGRPLPSGRLAGPEAAPLLRLRHRAATQRVRPSAPRGLV
ncbi:hypothetical protein [Streptomyces coelicoflavus]|uniref:Uncharacterized protein n=1 Tax=Streptomyces coelicoflavus TaxID=285562 RepID=A0A6N9V085_9ACTN|nr:hypothetical protein [Streptomyces coelicoflavus]NEB21979.1 hypothetical protein [Streptomyces coelicoflavus]